MLDLIITRSHLEIIFKSNIIDGIQEILQNFIDSNSNSYCCSLKAFNEKDNTIYV